MFVRGLIFGLALCRTMAFSAAMESVRAAAVHDVQKEGVAGDGKTDATAALTKLFQRVHDGDTVYFPRGRYIAPRGTTFVITSRIRIVGDSAELRNMRFLFLADMEIRGLALIEVDCMYDQSAPELCPPAGAMITLGYIGYPIHKAVLRDMTLKFSRAYTGIDMGYGTIENVTIENFSITDHQASAISIYGGRHIYIANGKIRGGSEPIVDDGVAISSYYGPISDVTVTNVSAEDTFDLVGIGANMYWPIKGVSITQSQCRQTAVCIYLKLGDEAPVPAPYTGYSELDGLAVSGITDEDPTGIRSLATVWLFAKQGAVGRNISISGIDSLTRNQFSDGLRVKVFLDGRSELHNVTFADLDMRDAHSGALHGEQTAGYPPIEGFFIQTLDTSFISGLRLRNVRVDGAAYYGIDSGQGRVSGLVIEDPDFRNIYSAAPNTQFASPFYIPFPFLLDGVLLNGCF